jgi:hypothetical protein
MGAAFPLADLSISGQLREVAKPEEFRLVLNLADYGVYQDLGDQFRFARQLFMIAFDRDKIGGLPSTQDLPVRR